MTVKRQTAAILLFLSTLVLVVTLVFHFGNESSNNTEEEFKTIIQEYIDKDHIVSDVFPSNIVMPAHQVSYPVAQILAGMAPSFEDFPRLAGMDYIRYIVDGLVSGTKFEEKININGVPVKDHINIYFLTKDERGLSRQFSDNCTFVGYYRAVLCDIHLIETLFDRIDSIEEIYDIAIIRLDEHTGEVVRIERPDISSDTDQRKVFLSLMKASVLTWVLGHEIGHAILHYELVKDEERQFHFDMAYSKEEEEADLFLSEQAAKEDGRGAEMATMLGEFIEQEFRRHYVEERYAGNTRYMSDEDRNRLRDVNFPLHYKIKLKQHRYRIPLLLRALHVKKALLTIAPQHGIIERYVQIEANIEIE